MKNVLVWIGMGAMLLLSACEKENGGGEKKISHHNKMESHHSGQNCMECHLSGGSGEGWFSAAGTVYKSSQNSVYPNAIVKLYTGQNGSGNLRGTIEVDGKGNFYTTDNINFGNGLYPTVIGNNSTKNMSDKITMGQCNSCHGVSTDRIWAD